MKADILLDQDPYIKEGKVVGFPSGWNLFPSGALTAAVVITNREFQCVEAFRSGNAVFVNLSEQDSVLTIGTQYSVPSGDIRADLDSWGAVPCLNFENFIISGDFNAREPAWGHSRPDARGRILSDFMQARRLVVCNEVGSLPSYFTSAGLGTWPDVTFASSSLLVKNWEVVNAVTASDHRYIMFRLGVELVRMKSNRFKTKLDNLRKFEDKLLRVKGDLGNLFVNCKTERDLKNDLDRFYQVIVMTAAASFKRVKFKELRSINWRTPQLREERSRIRALGKKLRRERDDIRLRALYNRALAVYKRNILKRKRQFWLHLCNTAADNFGIQFKLAHRNLLLP